MIPDPVGWIRLDVSVDSIVICVVANDMFIIIPLPDGNTFRAKDLVDLFGGVHFEITNGQGDCHTAALQLITPLGQFMNCPNGGWLDIYNSMEMIRHDLCCAQLDLWISRRQGIPHLPDNLACVTQLHLSLFDFPKQAFPPPRDE